MEGATETQTGSQQSVRTEPKVQNLTIVAEAPLLLIG